MWNFSKGERSTEPYYSVTALLQCYNSFMFQNGKRVLFFLIINSTSCALTIYIYIYIYIYTKILEVNSFAFA